MEARDHTFTASARGVCPLRTGIGTRRGQQRWGGIAIDIPRRAVGD